MRLHGVLRILGLSIIVLACTLLAHVLEAHAADPECEQTPPVFTSCDWARSADQPFVVRACAPQEDAGGLPISTLDSCSITIGAVTQTVSSPTPGTVMSFNFPAVPGGSYTASYRCTNAQGVGVDATSPVCFLGPPAAPWVLP